MAADTASPSNLDAGMTIGALMLICTLIRCSCPPVSAVALNNDYWMVMILYTALRWFYAPKQSEE